MLTLPPAVAAGMKMYVTSRHGSPARTRSGRRVRVSTNAGLLHIIR